MPADAGICWLAGGGVPRVRVAVANLKGGVGKTTAAAEMGYAAASSGQRVAVIDWEPQHSVTDRMRVAPGPVLLHQAVASGRRGAAVDVLVTSPWHDRLLVAPSTPDLALIGENADPTALFRLDETLDGIETVADLVLIDTGPVPGALLYAALIAADLVLVATEAELDSLRGLAKALAVVDRVQARLNPQLRVAGIVVGNLPLTAAGTPHQREATRLAEQLRTTYGDDLVWQPFVPRAEAPMNDAKALGQPAAAVRGCERVATAYARLAERLVLLLPTPAGA